MPDLTCHTEVVAESHSLKRNHKTETMYFFGEVTEIRFAKLSQCGSPRSKGAQCLQASCWGKKPCIYVCIYVYIMYVCIYMYIFGKGEK